MGAWLQSTLHSGPAPCLYQYLFSACTRTHALGFDAWWARVCRSWSFFSRTGPAYSPETVNFIGQCEQVSRNHRCLVFSNTWQFSSALHSWRRVVRFIMAEILLGISSSRSRPPVRRISTPTSLAYPLSILVLSIAARFPSSFLSLSLREISRPEITLLHGVVSVSPSRRDSRSRWIHLPSVENNSRLNESERNFSTTLRSELLTRIDFEKRAGDTWEDFPRCFFSKIRGAIKKPGGSQGKFGDVETTAITARS